MNDPIPYDNSNLFSRASIGSETFPGTTLSPPLGALSSDVKVPGGTSTKILSSTDAQTSPEHSK